MKQHTEKQKEFLQKLNSLLHEYDAVIGWTCGPCSDTHGVYDDRIYIHLGAEDIPLYNEGWIDSRIIERESR